MFPQNQQAMLMARMFQNPQGGGMNVPMPGAGGVGSGLPVGPSFDGPNPMPGVSPPVDQPGPFPYQGPMPDFGPQPYVPGNTPPASPMPYNPDMQAPPFGPMPMPSRPPQGSPRIPSTPRGGDGVGVRPSGPMAPGGRSRGGPMGSGMPDVTMPVSRPPRSSVRDGLLGKLRTDVVGPGVMTESEVGRVSEGMAGQGAVSDDDRARLIQAVMRRMYGM